MSIVSRDRNSINVDAPDYEVLTDTQELCAAIQAAGAEVAAAVRQLSAAVAAARGDSK